MLRAQFKHTGELCVTLFQLITSEGLTANQAAVIIDVAGVPGGLSSKAPLSELDLARLRSLAREDRYLGSMPADRSQDEQLPANSR
jgi:hypothetical protein